MVKVATLCKRKDMRLMSEMERVQRDQGNEMGKSKENKVSS